jgi:hypothetical protein
MKNLFKLFGLALAFTALTSCQGNMGEGKTDSVANNPSDTGTSTTVDTTTTQVDTTATDTTK